MPRQIPIDLTPEPDFSFDRFEIGDSNRDAAAMVAAWPNWPSPVLLLLGPSGSGKTHLGAAWAKKTAGYVLTPSELDLWGSCEPACVFVDNAEIASEADLFALVNAALNGKVSGLLLSSQTLPENWNISLPDLRSRLFNAPTAILEEHDDDVLEAIIRKLFEDQGRSVKADVVAYLMKNCDRSVEAMRSLVADLEAKAREAKRDITRAFVAKSIVS